MPPSDVMHSSLERETYRQASKFGMDVCFGIGATSPCACISVVAVGGLPGHGRSGWTEQERIDGITTCSELHAVLHGESDGGLTPQGKQNHTLENNHRPAKAAVATIA